MMTEESSNNNTFSWYNTYLELEKNTTDTIAEYKLCKKKHKWKRNGNRYYGFASAIIDDELQKKLRNHRNFPLFLSRPWLKSIGSTEIIDEIVDSSYDVIDAF